MKSRLARKATLLSAVAGFALLSGCSQVMSYLVFEGDADEHYAASGAGSGPVYQTKDVYGPVPRLQQTAYQRGATAPAVVGQPIPRLLNKPNAHLNSIPVLTGSPPVYNSAELVGPSLPGTTISGPSLAGPSIAAPAIQAPVIQAPVIDSPAPLAQLASLDTSRSSQSNSLPEYLPALEDMNSLSISDSIGAGDYLSTNAYQNAALAPQSAPLPVEPQISTPSSTAPAEIVSVETEGPTWPPQLETDQYGQVTSPAPLPAPSETVSAEAELGESEYLSFGLSQEAVAELMNAPDLIQDTALSAGDAVIGELSEAQTAFIPAPTTPAPLGSSPGRFSAGEGDYIRPFTALKPGVFPELPKQQYLASNTSAEPAWTELAAASEAPSLSSGDALPSFEPLGYESQMAFAATNIQPVEMQAAMAPRYVEIDIDDGDTLGLEIAMADISEPVTVQPKLETASSGFFDFSDATGPTDREYFDSIDRSYASSAGRATPDVSGFLPDSFMVDLNTQSAPMAVQAAAISMSVPESDDLGDAPIVILNDDIREDFGPDLTPRFSWPVHGEVFRLRDGQIKIEAASGKPVSNAAAGRVELVEESPQGTAVIIAHEGGWSSLLLGLSGSLVNVGDRVEKGAYLGYVGQAGELRFEVRDNREQIAEVLSLLQRG